MFGVCDTVPCNKATKSMACLFVPGKPAVVGISVVKINYSTNVLMVVVLGNAATDGGQKLKIEPLEPNIPSAGVRLLLEDGEFCATANKPRRTFMNLKVRNLNGCYTLLHFDW